MTERADVIIVTHTVHADIPEDGARAAIPTDMTVRGCVDIRPIRITLDESRGADWHALARTQKGQWADKVVPLLNQYPGARIAYFGLSPIPLAIHLGSLTGRWPAIDVYLRQHDASRSWVYPGGKDPEMHGPSGPHESTRSIDPAMIAINVTSLVDMEAARLIVGASSAELVLRTEPLGEDVLVSARSVQAAAEAFRTALNLLETNRPGIANIHLFAAIPCGLAFLIGTHVTSTRNARVVTYQHHRVHEPRLCEALRIPERVVATVPLTDIERVRTAAVRAAWEAGREALVAFARNAPNPWWRMYGKSGLTFATGAFSNLQSADETPLTSPISLGDTSVVGGFCFEPHRRVWILSDDLLRAISKSVDVARLDRAGRMLLLHEALHHGRQGLTLSSAAEIRLAPKVLEKLDYLADVWTMLHEFAFEDLLEKHWAEQRLALLEIVDDALSTMWAFDADRERGSLEVRRINRYLIWYVILVRIERAQSLHEALTILGDKPDIELVGPLVHVVDERLVARLDGQAARTYELCMLDRRGQLRRLGSTNAVSVERLAHSLGAHDGASARSIMRGFVEREDE